MNLVLVFCQVYDGILGSTDSSLASLLKFHHEDAGDEDEGVAMKAGRSLPSDGIVPRSQTLLENSELHPERSKTLVKASWTVSSFN